MSEKTDSQRIMVGPLGIKKRWMVAAQPPTRPMRPDGSVVYYAPRYFWSKRKAQEWVERLRRDGCFVVGVLPATSRSDG